jgi:hypothetical protein
MLNKREREIGMRHGGITGFEVKIGLDGGILEPGTGPSIRLGFSIKLS